ncbi:disease resistance protein Roq1-like [Arachis stenosperma]|uniref:disease resistance protein Roq1-like n=1 Tax=Arachis stenosperma TaxID=217475 RepID=UPI0025AB84D3|nr:disease resistance protein Roq1-like [Arachis stenosperma]
MKYKHDVFISFRGTDVRRGLLSHLKKDLHREKIDFYVDDAKLKKGDKILSLLTAIEESLILLVIFSKDYASSKWCLAELEKIIECAEKNEQIAVVPVFYKLDPSEVRHQRGDYAAAFVKHEAREDKVKVQKWRSALTKAAEFSGFHYPMDSELDESDVVDEIVEDICSKLRKFSSSESDDPAKSNGLVGIDKNIGWINSLMTNNSEQVLKIGFWGMGGIGKTTIAQLVFDKFSHQYEGCYFLENIRDELKNNQLNYLRDEVVSKLLGEENHHITGASRANSSTMRRLSKKKVILVLDNVNTPKLLRDFLEPIDLGPGSRVIVTSRNQQVFTAGVFHEIHHVKELNSEESLELFCLNAFNESQPKRGFKELSREAVEIAKGVPLALKVFGSYFHSKSNDIWKCALERFKKYPDPDGEIQSVLRFSYDELHDIEKKVFLDIAFFFKGEDKDYVISQLDAWKFYGASGIASLQEKGLIAISKDNKIKMHDLMQRMGWEIVRQESATPGRRSRVNDPEEVNDILKNNKGSDSVEGILLDLSQIGEVALNVDSLKKMPNLRLIKVYSPLPIEVPMQIRYFIPQDFLSVLYKRIKMDDLTEELLEESGSLNQSCDNEDIDDVVETIKGTQVDGIKILDTIIEMHILGMPKLNMPMHVEHPMPGLPIMQDLVKDTKSISTQPLMLSKLSKLGGVHKLANYNENDGVLILATNDLSRSMPQRNPNIGSAVKELISLGSEFHVKSTHHLFMEGSSVSKGLSFSTKEIRSINSTLNRTEALNSSVELFKNLECSDAKALQCYAETRMELLNSSTGCFISHDYSDIDDLQLETTRKDELSFLRSTNYYRLSNCRENKHIGKPKLLVLFDGLRYSEQMSILVLGGSSLQWSYLWCISNNSQFMQLPVGPQLTNCVELSLEVSPGSLPLPLLLSIMHLPPHLKSLSVRGGRSFWHKIKLPPFIPDVRTCRRMRMWRESLPSKINHHVYMEHLSLPRNLQPIMEFPTSIQSLDIDGYIMPEGLSSSLTYLPHLERLSLDNCTDLPFTSELPSFVQSLEISNGIISKSLSSNFKYLLHLKDLPWRDCSNFRFTSEFLSSIQSLKVSNSLMLESLSSSFKYLSNLKDLTLKNCSNLRSISELPSSIQSLKIFNCIMLESLPSRFKYLSSLQDLTLRDCINLRCISELPPSIQYMEIFNCIMLESLPSSFKYLSSLKDLTLRDCSNLRSILELPPSIQSLEIFNCIMMESLPSSFKYLSNLKDLTLRDCSNLRSILELPPSIQSLEIFNCIMMESLPSSFKYLSSLKDLKLRDCINLQFISELPPSIQYMEIFNCIMLESLPSSFKYLSSLKDLTLRDCSNL